MRTVAGAAREPVRGPAASGGRGAQAKEEDILETMQLLCQRHRHAAPGEDVYNTPFTPHTHPLHHVEAAMRNGGACEACGVHVRLVIVTPCAHVVCASCASADSTACVVPGCSHQYAMQAVDEPARCAPALA